MIPRTYLECGYKDGLYNKIILSTPNKRPRTSSKCLQWGKRPTDMIPQESVGDTAAWTLWPVIQQGCNTLSPIEASLYAGRDIRPKIFCHQLCLDSGLLDPQLEPTQSFMNWHKRLKAPNGLQTLPCKLCFRQRLGEGPLKVSPHSSFGRRKVQRT